MVEALYADESEKIAISNQEHAARCYDISRRHMSRSDGPAGATHLNCAKRSQAEARACAALARSVMGIDNLLMEEFEALARLIVDGAVNLAR